MLVLNVNDREGNRYIATRFLRAAGFEVIEANAGLQALVLARKQSPSVILLDVKLPDIDGLEVCRRLKNDPATAHLRVLHTSASTDGVDVEEQSKHAGGDAFLRQPFTQDELLAAVRALVTG